MPGPKGGFVLRGFPNYYMPDLTDFRLKAYVWPGEGLLRTNVRWAAALESTSWWKRHSTRAFEIVAGARDARQHEELSVGRVLRLIYYE